VSKGESWHRSRMRWTWLAFLVAVPVVGAACSPSTPKPTKIFGTITSASGASAPLTASAGIGLGFQFSAVLGGIPVTNGGLVGWQCFAPSPPSFPTYDMQASDGSTFLFTASVTTGSWHVGALAIDNTSVVVGIVTGDRSLVGTAGTLLLTSAGTIADSPGNNCSFSMANVPLVGTKD
jgi:hypothetical protein